MRTDNVLKFQARLGFALHVAPSAVDHPEAGAGLWLRGRALPGALVAFYPGLVYSRAHIRCACLHALLQARLLVLRL